MCLFPAASGTVIALMWARATSRTSMTLKPIFITIGIRRSSNLFGNWNVYVYLFKDWEETTDLLPKKLSEVVRSKASVKFTLTSWLVDMPPERTGPVTKTGLTTANSNTLSDGSSFKKSQAALSANVYKRGQKPNGQKNRTRGKIMSSGQVFFLFKAWFWTSESRISNLTSKKCYGNVQKRKPTLLL